MMNGMYAHNKLFRDFYFAGVEDLSALENDVFASEIVVAEVLDSYECALEDGWPDFIKDFYTL